MDLEEVVEDVVPDVITESSVARSAIIPVAVGLVALGAGIGIGYFLSRRKKQVFNQVIKLDPENFARPRVIVEEDHPAIKKHLVPNEEVPMTIVPPDEDYEDTEVVLTVDQVVVEEKTLFASSSSDTDVWDYKAEVDKRNSMYPYVIHRDEFVAEEMEDEGYIQSTLTYYAGDDILADEDSKPLYNKEDYVGNLIPEKFGHGSGDVNCVYIRNMARGAEYEVLRDPGLYSVEVEGLEIEDNARVKELKHSKNRKFRQEP